MIEQKILIVDDDTDFVEAVSSFLEANDCKVLKAHNGREGLTRAKLERPDLIIMDVMMDERTEGFFTVQEIRRTPGLESTPIFVMSSLYEQVPDFRLPPDKGWLAHDQFFRKPVNLPELLEKVREFLKSAQGPAADLPTGEKPAESASRRGSVVREFPKSAQGPAADLPTGEKPAESASRRGSVVREFPKRGDQ